ncbi:MAG TPA: glutamate 5-kinase [Burkholderiaceae bacterium]|nr:glutamate 5-kinase [Burkholderiaceae bacterium]
MSAAPGEARFARIVVKVGSSLVTNEGQGLDLAAISRWAGEVATLRASGKQVLIVSSGAIAEGMQRLGWGRRPQEVHELQAAAAVGQMGLAQAYETCFGALGVRTAQILLTHADLADRARYLNARSALLTLLQLGVVPVINENDTVVTDEIKFGDNDTLGALVTNLVEADALIILTDQQGLFDADPRRVPHARLIQSAAAGDPLLEQYAGGAGSAIGRGGMLSKLSAAKRAARSGAATIIACGREPEVLPRLMRGESIGTLLTAAMPKRAARKQWIADHLQTKGRVTIDAGAVAALCQQGKSLLPIGVIEVGGSFARGDVISCFDVAGREVARGLVNYSSAEAGLIARRPSAEIAQVLGFMEETELIHRDNLVLL